MALPESLNADAKSDIRGAINGNGAKCIIAALSNINGLKFDYASGAASGTASVEIQTSLTTVLAFSFVQLKATAPTQLQITYTISGNEVNVYFWKATSAGDNTLIADTSDISYKYIAIGT